AEFLVVDRPQDLDGVLRRGFEVESSGWKGSAGTGILSTPENEQFWHSLADTFDRSNETRLSAITLDGRMAAFDLTLLVNQRLYLLKTGYDESFARLRPGLVLRLAARYLYRRTRPHLLRAYRATRSTLERSTGRRARPA